MLRSTGERGSALARNSSGVGWWLGLARRGTQAGSREAGREGGRGDIIQEKYVSNVTIRNMWPRQVAQTDHVNECRGGGCGWLGQWLYYATPDMMTEDI